MQNVRQLTEISRITTFNLKNDTALLLGTLIFLLGYTDYDLDYKRQNLLMTYSNKTEKICNRT